MTQGRAFLLIAISVQLGWLAATVVDDWRDRAVHRLTLDALRQSTATMHRADSALVALAAERDMWQRHTFYAESVAVAHGATFTDGAP